MAKKSPTEAKARQVRRTKENTPDKDLALAQQLEQEAAEARRNSAEHALSAAINSAVVVKKYGKKIWGEADLQTIVNGLAARCELVRGGDMEPVESLLVTQAKALDTMFSVLSCRALAQELLTPFDVNLRLALRAQNQCRMTLETLAAIKNPPIFAKQANIAHGHQQVNNGSFQTSTHAPARAEEIPNQPDKLLEHDHGERMDARAAGTTGRGDQAMATVAVIHGSANRKR